MITHEDIIIKAKASISWIYSNILGKTIEAQLRTAKEIAQAREEYVSWVSYLLPIEQALTELETLKQEIIERQETEESLGKEFIKVGDELETLKRYPTIDDVCKALSEYFKDVINYDGTLGFTRGKNKKLIYWYENGELEIYDKLPPRLITLISRFYEGLEKVGKEE